MSTQKQYDIVVYGATGFTGRLVAEYLADKYTQSDIKWAMAGRSEEKLTSVRDEIGAPSDTPFVVADAEDLDSLKAMVASTKVVITTVGPYQLYGSELVSLCAGLGTDYVDLCGEPAWMHDMITAHQEKAQQSGARIVFSCGFDSIPFDMGVFYLQQLAKEKFGKTLSRVKGRVKAMKGTFSGGTAASLKATMAAAHSNPDVMKVLLNPFSLTPGFQGADQPHGNKPYFEEEFNSWVAPFIMAAINTRNIHRSNALLSHEYGTDFVYDEMMFTGPGEKGEEMAKAVAGDKSLASDKGPKPGEGPSKEERESGFYDLMFFGSDESGNTLAVSVKGDKDPGYGSTSKMIAESAICLATGLCDKQGGVWTPAPALGQNLINRLQENAGLTFKAV